MRKTAIVLALAFFCLAVLSSAAQKGPLKVCLVSGSEEYKSDISLAAYKKWLEENYNARCTLVKAIGFEDLPGLEALDDCDVALFFTRRLRITGEQLERVKKYCTSGKPVVACRTASHGFQNWLEFDKLILGGNYSKHFGAGIVMQARIEPAAKSHPILEGIGDFTSTASLYRTGPLAEDCALLITGSTPQSEGSHPLAWARVVNGGRVFYTSLGALSDFENDTFRRMMANALFWTAKRPVERK